MTEVDPPAARSQSHSIRALLVDAASAYAEATPAQDILTRLQQRFDEPLRVALAGRIKAGKSTLLNAIVGEQLAPTDTGECTRVVTWYRHGPVPDVRVVGRDGEVERRPVRRVDGRLHLDTGSRDAADVLRLDVTWPSPALERMTVIDTPGLASLSTEVSERTTEALTPSSPGSEVDAVIYLMRHLHTSDAELLEAFREATVGETSAVGTLAVLSRADEIGGGRIDAMVSSAEVARRYAHDPRVRAMALDVFPVAGLLAEGARTLRQLDYDALREIAHLDPRDREGLLVSADRFATSAALPLEVATPEVRSELLSRLGTFGVRLSTALLRGPVRDATTLAHELTRRSGLGPLTAALSGQLAQRAEVLKGRAVLAALERVLIDHPVTDGEELAARADELRAGDHAVVELEWLSRLRLGAASDLDAPDRDAAARILGAEGTEPSQRLAADPTSSHEVLRDLSDQAMAQWRTVATDPLSDREAVAVAQVALRSLDGLRADLDARGPRPTSPESAPH